MEQLADEKERESENSCLLMAVSKIISDVFRHGLMPGDWASYQNKQLLKDAQAKPEAQEVIVLIPLLSKATPTSILWEGNGGWKMHVAFDKRKVECFNCHNSWAFCRNASLTVQRKVAGRGRRSIGRANYDEELNHALMAFTVNNEVSMCSKLCLDSFNALKAKYDELQSEFGDQEAALTAHKLGLKKLESQLRASHKQQISLNEKLHFQANQIFEKDEKLKKYRRIGMKAVKDKDALQKIVDSWFASSKNLWKLIDCGMSSTVKLGLGYSIKSNAEVLSYEEEMNRGIFASIRETDPGYYDIPLYSRFKQVEYKGVPHPLSGDYTLCMSMVNLDLNLKLLLLLCLKLVPLFPQLVNPMTVMGNKELYLTIQSMMTLAVGPYKQDLNEPYTTYSPLNELKDTMRDNNSEYKY
ncbi:hypothetical protein Tco_0863593 [Tanacetum coccineum]